MQKHILNRRETLKLTLAGAAGLAMPYILVGHAEAKSTKGINYGANRLDIYQPSGAANAPVMMFVHGGAWKSGSRRSVGSKPRYFNKNGYVFLSVGYTLYPAADAEAQALQVAQAVNWAASNASQFGGNPNRISLMGHSAGCHLAALASLSGATKSVRALICNDTGAYDLPYLASLNGGRLPLLFSALNRKEKWKQWSPISYVGNRRQPPTMVIWSGGRNRDKIGNNFASALQNAGNSVTRFDGSGYNHLSINSSMGKKRSVTRATENFLNANL